MGDDLVIDTGTAEELAGGLTGLNLSGVPPLPWPGGTNLAGTTAGVNLGNWMRTAFGDLNTLIDGKAGNLVEIAQIMVAEDALIAGSIR